MNNLQKNIILTLLNTNGCSRKKMAELLNVTRAAITQNTNILLDNNIIEYSYQLENNRAGRKEEVMILKSDAFFSYGIDIESDRISLVKLDAISTIVEQVSFNNIQEVIAYFNNKDEDNILGIALSKKGFYNTDLLEEDEKKLYDYLSNKYANVYFLNNIAALAYGYKYLHPSDTNFILIKYGPGLGSACFIDNKLLEHKTSPTYEIGKMIYNTNGDIVEDIVKYSSFASNDKSAIKALIENNNVQERVLNYLAVSIININTCLQLDKIVVSGDIFKYDNIFEKLVKTIKAISPKFNIKKLVRIENYSDLSLIKSAIAAKYLSLQ